MGERVLLELSWLAWNCANFAQPVSGHMMPIKTEHPCWQMSSGAGERLARQGHGGDPPRHNSLRSWEALLHSLDVWDRPWALTGPPGAPLPRSSHSPWPAWPRNAGEGGRQRAESPAQEVVCMPRSGATPLGPLPGVLALGGAAPPCLSAWGEPLSFRAVFAVPHPLGPWRVLILAL